jgi:hypothetical protein
MSPSKFENRRMSKGEEVAMRTITKAFLSCAFVAAVGLLAAAPAVAADLPKSCPTPNGWTVETEGVTHPSPTTSEITYTVTGRGSPDHTAVFVRAEAGKPSVSGSSAAVSDLCDGDNAMGIAHQTLCHEYIARFNNKQAKGNTFTVSVNKFVEPILTSVIVKRGSQGACPIEGLGLEPFTSVSDACVASCGNFDPKQGITKKVRISWQDCVFDLEFDVITGDFLGADLIEALSGDTCVLDKNNRPVSELALAGDGITFAEGSVSSGDDSCYTYFNGGRYCRVCR